MDAKIGNYDDGETGRTVASRQRRSWKTPRVIVSATGAQTQNSNAVHVDPGGSSIATS
jgi:hypothetical protein